MLGYSIKENWKWCYQQKKSTVKKTKNYQKNPQMILTNYIQIYWKEEKKKSLMGMWVFSAKILYIL